MTNPVLKTRASDNAKSGPVKLSGGVSREERVSQRGFNPLWHSLATHVEDRSATEFSRAPSPVQTKLTVGAPDDPYEKEADAVADKVMRVPAGEQEELKDDAPSLQRRSNNSASLPSISNSVSNTIRSPGSGSPLNESVRSRVEPVLGAGLSNVRVHSDGAAQKASQHLNAKAFTHKNNIFLGRGQSASDARLMAHEATHIVQQQSMRKVEILQRTRKPDTVYRGHHTFYLNTGTNARELAVQFYYSGSGRSVTVKIAHTPTRTMRQSTFQLSGGATFKPTILIEARGVATFDLDGDGKEDMQVLTAVEDYSVRLATTDSTPTSMSRQSYAVRDVYVLAQFGSTRLVIEAAGQGLPEKAIWSPRWQMASHPHPNISMVWRDSRTSRYQIPPVGASMGGIHSSPAFIRARLPITSRAAWGARAPITNDPERSYEPYTKPLAAVYDSIVVHHSGNKGYRSMSVVQNIHMGEKQSADIGYHFGIGLSGRIYTGRPLSVKGAHVAGANTGKIGIVLLADLDTKDEGLRFYQIDWNGDDSFTDRMQAALIRLIEQLRSKFPGIIYLGGHKEFDRRRHCPGNLTMGRMGTLRAVTSLQAPP